MITYTWTIVSVDETTNTMVVSYRFGALEQALNIPAPGDAELIEHVRKYAPLEIWKTEPQNLQELVGLSGDDMIVEAEAAPESESPNIMGSWSEEYIRALIYQVLEEAKELEV